MKATVENIGVVGAGQMGRGIAQVAASCGLSVKMYDVSREALEAAMAFIERQLGRGVEKGKWDESHAEATLKRLSLTDRLEQLGESELIIEAATENKAVKFDIFRQLDEVAAAHAVLASNTSSISITEIAAVTERPERVVGMHFMNPVPVMPLVEVIGGLESGQQSIELVEEVAQTMGKVCIRAKDVAGFTVNRILMPMINEAIYTFYEGVSSKEDIDRGMKLGTNWPMGPLTLADFIGLDTCLAIMQVLHEGLGDDKYRPCPLLKQYVSAGRMGKKSGRGFYDYT